MSETLEASSFPASLNIAGGESVELTAAAADAAEDAPKQFSAVAYTGAAMSLRGFMLPTVVDLQGVKVPSQVAPVLREHNPERPIGHSETIEVSAQRIKVSGALSHPGEDTDKVIAAGKKKYPWQTSIGLQVERVENFERGQTVKVNGKNFTGPLTVVRASTWRELSFVTLGADHNTSATLAAKLNEGDPMTFSEWLKAKGVDEATTAAGTLDLLRAQYKAEQLPKPKPGEETETLEASMAKEKKERERKTEVTKLFVEAAQEMPEKIEELEAIGKQALEAGWDVDKCEQRILMASVKQAAPFAFSKSAVSVTGEVLEAGLSLTMGLDSADKVYSEKVLDAAHKKFKGRLGLHQAIGICARAYGFEDDTVNSGNVHAALKAAFRGAELRASSGPSTYDIGGIIGNSLRKKVRENYNYVERVWPLISVVSPCVDFKQVTSYSLTGDLTYDKVAPGGEIKHGSLGETSRTNQADSYGKGIAIDRTTLINDDMGALGAVGKRLGRGGALKENDVIWSVFKDNASFFSSGNGNYTTGTATAFSLDGLEAANTLWKARTDPDGKPLGAMARLVLVPSDLEIRAARLLGSQYLTANDEEGENNPFAGKYTVVSSVYLNDSTTGWYMLCDPNDVPVLEVLFLNGKQEPTIESVDMMPGRLGLIVVAVHDFGAALQDPTGGHKFKGVV